MTIRRIPTSSSPESLTIHRPGLVDKPKEQKTFKILVIGEVSVGKTSLIKRYVHNLFSNQYRATIGVDFALKKIIWSDEIDIIIQLWDIAGQDRFASLTRVYYKGASGSFVITDASNPDSFESAIKWKRDFDSKVTLENGQPVPSLLLVNKCDLEKVGIAGDESKLDCFSKENGFTNWCYVSAKDNIGIKEAAKLLIKKIMAIVESQENQKNGIQNVDDAQEPGMDNVIIMKNGKADHLSPAKKSKCEC